MPHRILNADEVAEYLHIPRRELDHLVRRGEIPHEKIGDRPVFRKIEIDAWASQRLLSSGSDDLGDFHEASSAKQHDLSDGHAIIPELMKPTFIKLGLASRTRASLLRDVVALADETGKLIEAVPLLESLEEREQLGSTALTGGVALLHPQHHDPYMFEDSFIALIRTVQSIPFGSPDGHTTDLFFVICSQADDIHLHVLARLCMMCHHTGLLLDLREAESPEAAWQLLVEAEETVIREKLKAGS